MEKFKALQMESILDEVSQAILETALGNHRRILELKCQANQSFILLGKEFRESKEMRYFEFLGYPTFEAYESDGNTEALLLTMRDVAEAQGGIGELAKRTAVSREHLYEILAGKYNPRLDNWLNILSGLGFRVRLERQKTAKIASEPVSSRHGD